jgi:hypothetical protein
MPIETRTMCAGIYQPCTTTTRRGSIGVPNHPSSHGRRQQSRRSSRVYRQPSRWAPKMPRWQARRHSQEMERLEGIETTNSDIGSMREHCVKTICPRGSGGKDKHKCYHFSIRIHALPNHCRNFIRDLSSSVGLRTLESNNGA